MVTIEIKQAVTPDEHPSFGPRQTEMLAIPHHSGRSIYFVPFGSTVNPEVEE